MIQFSLNIRIRQHLKQPSLDQKTPPNFSDHCFKSAVLLDYLEHGFKEPFDMRKFE